MITKFHLYKNENYDPIIRAKYQLGDFVHFKPLMDRIFTITKPILKDEVDNQIYKIIDYDSTHYLKYRISNDSRTLWANELELTPVPDYEIDAIKYNL
jgi:hypothetical protein